MKILLTIAALAAASATSAQAATFAFSYTTVNGITAGDTIQATLLGTDVYSVDNVIGSRGGAAITGYDYYDPTPQSFTYGNGSARDVDFSYYVGTDNYEVRYSGNGYGSEFRTDASGAVTSLLVTSFTLRPASTPAVPEPASWALMLAGFAATGVALRRPRGRTALA